MVERTSTTDVRERPRFWRPWVASRRRSWATTRCTSARSWAAPVGSARSSSFSGREGGSDSVRSISARSSSRRTWRSNSRRRSRGTASGSGCSALGCSPLRSSVRRMRWTSTPITPEPSPWRPKAAMARRARSRIWPSPESSDWSASRMAWRSSSRSIRSPPSEAAWRVGLADALLHGLALGGAEEEAVEHQLQHAPVLLALGQRGRQRLAELGAVGPAHRLERAEAVQQLGGAHGHALAAQLVGELQQARRHAGRARTARPCRRRAGG